MKKRFRQFQLKTIGSKLLVGTCISIIPVVLIILIIVGKISSDTLIRQSKEIAVSKNESMVNKITAEYGAFYQLAIDMGIRVKDRLGRAQKDRKVLAGIIKDGLNSNPNVVGSGIFFEPNGFDGRDREFANRDGYDQYGRISEYYSREEGKLVKSLEDTSDLDKQEWYRVPMADGKSHMSEPYVQQVGQVPVLMATISIPIQNAEGRLVGVITVDINLESFQVALEKESNPNIIFQMITKAGTVAGHGLVRDNVMKHYQELEGNDQIMGRIGQGEDFEIIKHSRHLNKEVYIKFTPIQFPNVPEVWTISSVWVMTEFTKDVSKLVVLMGMVASLGAVLVFVVIFLLSQHLIKKPMANMVGLVKQLSDFDFVIFENENLKRMVGREDEIGEISRSIEQMANNVRQLVAHILESSQNVAATSQELTATAETNRSAVQEIANAIEDIARSATEQAQNTEKTSENMEKIGQMIEGNVDIIRSLTEATDQIELRKNEGNTILRELISGSEKSTEVAGQVFDTVKATNDSAERIETVSGMIQSIADQTNLLALNAAIEAARAGESGRGFAVVAEEIRKLAEQSTGFTGEIKQVISDLKLKTEKAVEAMNQVLSISKDQRTSSDLTGEKFELISQAVERIKDMVKQLNISSAHMQKSKSQIVENVQDLSRIAQQNAASSEEVASTVQNQLESIVGIADASSELSIIANALQEEVQAFRI